MRIGIVSDTHGKSDRLQTALALLARRNVQAVVHCGDVGSAQCVDVLGGCGVPAYLVAGNVDRHLEDLQIASGNCSVRFASEVLTVPIGGGRFLAVTHGHDAGVLRELIRQQKFPYVCHGHSHSARDERIGPVHVINPGALHHPRGPYFPTVAVLDSDADTVEQLPVQ